MAIFMQAVPMVDPNNPQDAIKKFYNHLKYMQETLDYTLLNLDSTNINEIDIDQTTITGSSANTNIGTLINLTGENGESFTVGKNSKGLFEFTVNGKDGKQTMYLNSSGELIITEHANFTIDGGEW